MLFALPSCIADGLHLHLNCPTTAKSTSPRTPRHIRLPLLSTAKSGCTQTGQAARCLPAHCHLALWAQCLPHCHLLAQPSLLLGERWLAGVPAYHVCSRYHCLAVVKVSLL